MAALEPSVPGYGQRERNELGLPEGKMMEVGVVSRRWWAEQGILFGTR